ncbi:hypothetical protein [Streptomyces sp. NPDC127092]|uniref:hypothetical protein n=1 Tax=Streptomyces sp. NPDC127092 TaxID=3347135 RepID=UPI003654A5C7
MLHEAGFPLPRTLDVLYSLTSLVVGPAAAQAGEVGEAGSMAVLDPDTYPLLAGAARELGENAAQARFDFAVHALLSGFERELALTPTLTTVTATTTATTTA